VDLAKLKVKAVAALDHECKKMCVVPDRPKGKANSAGGGLGTRPKRMQRAPAAALPSAPTKDKPTKPAPTPSPPSVDVETEKTRRLKEKQDAQREAELAEKAKKEGADESKNLLLRAQEKWETERLSLQMALEKSQGETLKLQLDKEENMNGKGGDSERGKRGSRTDQEERKRKDYRLQRSDDGAADSNGDSGQEHSESGSESPSEGRWVSKRKPHQSGAQRSKKYRHRKKHARASSSEPGDSDGDGLRKEIRNLKNYITISKANTKSSNAFLECALINN
jgi:hypothetical protein